MIVALHSPIGAVAAVQVTAINAQVVDQEKVDEEALRATGAFGVVRSGRVVQVVVGPSADELATAIAELD